MEHLFDEIKRYIEFGSEDEANLVKMGPLIGPHIGRIVDDFYDRILKHPGASRSITGGLEQVRRLKGTLRLWLEELFLGPWDVVYYERRARIGRRHVQINLPQQYMLTAVNVIRGHLIEILQANNQPREIQSLNKLLDMELAIMLHTYREDYLAKEQKTERLAVYGQLAVSIAHELRNPLGVIESSAFLLKRKAGQDSPLLNHINKIEAQVRFSNQVISDLLDMVRDRPVQREDVEVSSLLQGLLEGFSEGARAQLKVEVAPNLLPLWVDRSQILQILTNLLNNAIEAGGQGPIVIGVSAAEEGMTILINDSGPGIDPAIQARLFEPLFTTKSRGIGLGLALSRRLAERNGGRLELTQGPLSGAAFALTLPTRQPR